MAAFHQISETILCRHYFVEFFFLDRFDNKLILDLLWERPLEVIMKISIIDLIVIMISYEIFEI